MSILRAGLYERVSTDEQALHGYSIGTQIATLEEYCRENNIKIVNHYTDEGISGAKSPLKRPALQRLLNDVQAGKIDIIIFTKLDRWFRSVQEYYKVQEILDKHNVAWKTILEDYNTATADGRLKVNIMLSVAANERERDSERVKAVLKHKIKNKEAAFGGKAPWGFIKQKDEQGIKRLVKDPETQDMVQEFWDMMLKYENLNKVANYMGDTHGIIKPIKWWADVKNREFYCGCYRGIEDFCPAYITRADWLRLKSKPNIKKTQKNKVYLFTGLIKCPVCGHILSCSSCTKKNKTYISYRCKYILTRICSNNKYLSETKLEKYMLDNLEQLINLEIQSVEIEKATPKKKPKTDVAKLKEKLRKLNVMYMAGGKTDEEYIQETAEIKALIDQASQETPQVERDINPLKELLKTDFRALYEAMTRENKRRFWRSIIKEIHLEPNGKQVKTVVFL